MLSKDMKAKECDATEFNSSNTAGFIIKIFALGTVSMKSVCCLILPSKQHYFNKGQVIYGKASERNLYTR